MKNKRKGLETEIHVFKNKTNGEELGAVTRYPKCIGSDAPQVVDTSGITVTIRHSNKSRKIYMCNT